MFPETLGLFPPTYKDLPTCSYLIEVPVVNSPLYLWNRNISNGCYNISLYNNDDAGWNESVTTDIR